MIPRTRAKIRAGRYPSTLNPSTNLSVRSTIIPDMRNDISPRVRKLSGAVIIRANPPIKMFTRENTRATMSAVQYESTLTPGMI